MRARGFTLMEIMLVCAVIGIGGSLAVFAMSDQVQASRARSDELGMALKIKTERNKARERMQPMLIRREDEGSTIVFHRARITGGGTGCEQGAEVARARFEAARLLAATPSTPDPNSGFSANLISSGGNNNLCLDEQGRPVGIFIATIEASDGRQSTLGINPAGIIETNIGGSTSSNTITDERVETRQEKASALAQERTRTDPDSINDPNGQLEESEAGGEGGP